MMIERYMGLTLVYLHEYYSCTSERWLRCSTVHTLEVLCIQNDFCIKYIHITIFFLIRINMYLTYIYRDPERNELPSRIS